MKTCSVAATTPFLAFGLLLCLQSALFAQSWAVNHASKLMLPSGGNDPSQTLTLQAPSLSASSTLTLPSTNDSGYLTNDGSGNLSWTTLSSTITEAHSTASTTIKSSSDALLDGMTVTPGAGDYLVWFSSTTSCSNHNVGHGGIFSIYAGSSQIAQSVTTVDDAGQNSMKSSVYTMAYVTGLADATAITVQWHCENGADTQTAYQRTMLVQKVK